MFFVEDAKTLAYSFALSQFSSQLCDFRRHGCFAICTIYLLAAMMLHMVKLHCVHALVTEKHLALLTLVKANVV